MSHYSKEFVNQIIRDRAIARRERRDRRATNPEALRVFVPFRQWLRHVKGIEDPASLSRYRLWENFNEYQLDCVRFGLDSENPRNYDLYNTLID